MLGAVVLVALHEWRGLEYWNYSEGVYALTSRLFLHGGDLYGQIIVAQPPWQFFYGAGALAIHDSMTFLRLAVGLAQLGAGVLAAVAVKRLTDNPFAIAAAPALILLTPWAVREHGALTPELLAPPILLGAALLASRPQTALAAGALAATAPFLKWPYAIPLAAIVLFSASPRKAIVGAAVACVVQAVAFTALFGFGLWDDSVIAQMASERRGFDILRGLWGQAVWSLIALVILAALAYRYRAKAKDAPLLKVLIALAVAMLATLATNTKDGTGLNVLVPVEAALVPLALAGAAFSGRRLIPAALLAFTLVQSLSLITTPRTATPFIFPTSERGAWGLAATPAEVDRELARVASCAPGVPYSGPPFIAFLADREMPDDQPDQFLPQHSPHLKEEGARIAAVQPRCP